MGHLMFADVDLSILPLPPVCNSLFKKKKKKVVEKVDAGEEKLVVLLFL